MGNRANVAIKQDMKNQDGSDVYIYLYTHWNGDLLPFMVKSALKNGQSRWGHTAYITRIIFSEMIKKEVEDVTGYGISVNLVDNEHPIIYIDDKINTVTIKNTVWNYKEFIDITDEEIYRVYSDNNDED